MTVPFRVIALIAAHNEDDIIEACLEHLCRQGIESYLLDDGSTDRTAERAAAFIGRGLIAVEPLPQTTPPTFSLRRILARKEALAASLDASWFINQDADEFRDSAWSELDLRQAFERVDRLGWNAIDFEVFTMRPVGDPATAWTGPDQSPCWYAPPGDYDRLQVRAWKNAGTVDLCSSGGHDVQYEGRAVFPLRFPMRHYPIRSRAQGVRKVFTERLPRFDPGERAQGWHVQYDRCDAPDSLIAASEVVLYDPVDARVRSALRNRDLEKALAVVEQLEARAEQLSRQVRRRNSIIQLLKGRTKRLRKQQAQGDAQEPNRAERSGSADELRTMMAERDELRGSVERMEMERARVESAAADVALELARIRASRTWRWTKPLRMVVRLFGAS
jgi:glycosyltransferase involved in cell wall biosynthesis